MAMSGGGDESERTVVVVGVPATLTPSRMNDKLIIHFQSSRSGGGDVAKLRYPTGVAGLAHVTFDYRRDADKVVQTTQVLKDRELPQEYSLTVYKMTPEATFHACADLDLSLFPDRSTLLQNLRSTHRSLRIGPLDALNSVSVEGPFPALQDLRHDLLARIKSVGAVKSTKESDNGRDCPEGAKLWLDTHVYMYIQTLEREEWDKCLARYKITADVVQAGEVTQVRLRGDSSPATLSAARADLQELVSQRQRALRTHRIDYSSTDPGAMERLINTCKRAQGLYRDVCYILLDSYIEVIGPSFSSYMFCDFVKNFSQSHYY